MKRLTLLFVLVALLLAPSAAFAQSITGSVVEAESGNPLSSENWPYVSIMLYQNRGGQLAAVAGTDCWSGNYVACADANGTFTIRSTWDNKPLEGTYILTISSQFHLMVTTKEIVVGAKGVNIGDIQMHRRPAGFYVTKVDRNSDGDMIIKGRVFRSVMGPAPELAVRLSYSGPGVTVSYVTFDAARQMVVWENETTSQEMTFVLRVNSKLIDGTTFSGLVCLERADSAFHQYSQQYFVGVKGVPDYIGW